MIELDFKDLASDFTKRLEKYENIVLSTCSNNMVSSRTMCFANDGFSIYLLTGKQMGKCIQIEQNENVSLCIDDIQIGGKARIIGHPMETNNKDISEIFKNKHKKYFERFAHVEIATFIEVKCDFAKQWRMEDGKDYYYFMDVNNAKAVKYS